MRHSIPLFFCKLILLALLLSGANVVPAQTQKSPNMSFEKKVHFLGNIVEEKGKVYTQFYFENKGNAPLVITRIRTDCGCMVPAYNRAGIPAGSKDSITIAFDPMGRSGTFIKKIRVYANDNVSPHVLEIKGNVISAEGRNLMELHYKIGELELLSETLSMGLVTSKKKGEVRSVLKNNYPHPIKVKILSLPSYISSSMKEIALKSGEPTEIFFETIKNGSYRPGFYNDPIKIGVYHQGKRVDEGMIHIFATLLPDLPIVSKEGKRNTAQTEINTWLDLGLAPKEAIQKGTIEIKNKRAKQPLTLLDAYSHNKAVSLKIKKGNIPPNQIGLLDYEINMKEVEKQGGKLEENIELLLTDPYSPVRKVRIMIAVKK